MYTYERVSVDAAAASRTERQEAAGRWLRHAEEPGGICAGVSGNDTGERVIHRNAAESDAQ